MKSMTKIPRAARLVATTLALALPAGLASAAEEAPPVGTLQVERLEHRWNDGENAINWKAYGWVGGDTDKLWFTTEGSKPVDGAVADAEVQLLYSRMVSEFWDVQAGIRHDIRPEPQTTYAVAGVRGVAPLFLDVGAHAFLSEDGDLSARLETEYDLLITQELILQPAVEVRLSAQRVDDLEIGRGINSVEAGVRLFYAVTKEVLPYVGVSWERSFGETADFARANGEDVSGVSVVAGVRVWF